MYELSKGTISSERPTAVGEREAERLTIEGIYKAFPRQEAKRAALKAITNAVSRLASDMKVPRAQAAQHLRARVDAYARSKYVRTTDRKFIPLPATWFNAGRYDDPDTAWERDNTPMPSRNGKHAPPTPSDPSKFYGDGVTLRPKAGAW